MSRVIQPGATIGVLGGGQLGRMFTIAARRLGYRVHVLCPDDDTPAGQVADVEIKSSYDDLDSVAHLARSVDVVTFEFENVPAVATDCADRYAPVRPGGSVLQVTQHRAREKSSLRQHGFPTAEFAFVQSVPELLDGVNRLGTPCVLKTASWGYDGKGQCVIHDSAEVESAWDTLGGEEGVLEQFVDFECELSVIGVRDLLGNVECYGPIFNTHANHILDVSVVPAGLPPIIETEASSLARAILEEFDVVGVLCVEFFLTRCGQLLVNELAPRPHNSGHLTIDAHVTCQFEQQVRAVCGLPLGSPELIRPAAMANLLGDVWDGGPPQWQQLLAYPDVKLHLYGKQTPRPGRKMGHITVQADLARDAEKSVRKARDSIVNCPVKV